MKNTVKLDAAFAKLAWNPLGDIAEAGFTAAGGRDIPPVNLNATTPNQATLNGGGFTRSLENLGAATAMPPPPSPMPAQAAPAGPDWKHLFEVAHGKGSYTEGSAMDARKMQIMKQMAAGGVDTSNAHAFARKLYANPEYRKAFPQYSR